MKKVRNVLTIQTVEMPAEVGIYSIEKKKLISKVTIRKREQAVEMLAEKVENLLKETKLDLGDIGLIAVCSGPGSYTGTRGGLAFAKGMVLKNEDLRLVGVSAFEVFENLLEGVSDFIVLMDARNKRVYYKKSWEDDFGVGELESVLQDMKPRTVLVGSGVREYKKEIVEFLGKDADFIKNDLDQIDIKILAETGLKKLDQNPSIFSKSYLYEIKPLYILSPNITKSKKK